MLTITTNSTVQTITPELAAEWLAHPANKNRRVSATAVGEYARAMSQNRWQLNGEAIKLGVDGRCIDGQHRLKACIKSGCSFRSYVTVGLNPDVFDTIDAGRKRTAADALGMDGVKNTAAVAAAIKCISAYRAGLWHFTNMKLSADEIRLFVAAEPAIESSVAFTQNAREIIAPSLAGALHFLFAEKDQVGADQFFADLTLGANLSPTDPVFAFRERLIKDRMSKANLQKEELFAMGIRAWRRRRSNSGPTRLLKGSIVVKEGDKRKFPEIV